MLRKLGMFSAFVATLALTAVYVGCSNSGPGGPAEGRPGPLVATASEQGSASHAHDKPGAHGGNIVEIGRDNYHAEAVFEKGGRVKLYLLGKDQTRVVAVEMKPLAAYAKFEGDAEAVPFSLGPVPQPGDPEGKTSQFVGKLPKELGGKHVEVTVPSISIAGERFRFGFTSTGETHDDAIGDAEERRLFLTPGGKYTAADINANGAQSAADKFRGIRAAHNLRTKPGDKICPITLTRANPQFTWMVGGKEYQFCCPPCVAEFVRLAKEHPEEIKQPEDYVAPSKPEKGDSP